MKNYAYLVITILIISFIVISIIVYKNVLDISTASVDKNLNQTEPFDLREKEKMYFGVISRYSPNLIYEGYQPIMNYLSRVTKYQFILRLSQSYEETVEQLDRGEVQAAFLGTYIYLKTRHSHHIRCILKPLNNQFEPYFHSVIVTRTDSPLHFISELRGKRLALPSPLSFSGNWLPRYELKKYGLQISDLDSVHYFDHHHTVIYQVLRGNFDAGVVKDRVAQEFKDRGIRIIAVSDPIPGSPIVVKEDINQDIIEAIQDALLKIDIRKPEFAEIVKDWDPEFSYGFSPAQPEDYDHIEAIVESVEISL